MATQISDRSQQQTRGARLVPGRGLVASWTVAAVLLILIALAAIGQSARKVFWWDELASYDTAHLPHFSDVWSFFHDGLDTPSPLPTLIVQAALHTLGSNEVMVRLPFTAGYLLMCLGLYGCVRRRYSPGYALAAMLIPATCGAFYYASELRTYGIVLGAVAMALFCWQGLEANGSAEHIGPIARIVCIFGLFACLSIAIACHIFTVFALIPFAIGQITRDWLRRKVDFLAWAALALAPLSLIPELPGLSAAHRNYAGLFWSKPTGGQIIFSYVYAVTIGWLAAALLVVLICAALGRHHASFAESGEESGFTQPEWVLIAALALLPLFAWPLSHMLGVYVARYVLPLLIGVSLAVVGGIAETLRRNRVSGVVLALAMLIVFLQDKRQLITASMHTRPDLSSQYQSESWVRTLAASNLPVVAPNTQLYTQMQHYVAPALEQRLFYAAHTPGELRPAEDADAEFSMLLFAKRLPLRVQEFTDFASSHPEFLIVVNSPLSHDGPVASKKIADSKDEPALAVHWLHTFAGGEELNFAHCYIYKVERIPAANGLVTP